MRRSDQSWPESPRLAPFIFMRKREGGIPMIFRKSEGDGLVCLSSSSGNNTATAKIIHQIIFKLHSNASNNIIQVHTMFQNSIQLKIIVLFIWRTLWEQPIISFSEAGMLIHPLYGRKEWNQTATHIFLFKCIVLSITLYPSLQGFNVC